MSHGIALRAFEDDDLPLFESWLARPHVAAWFGDPLAWIDEVKERRGDFAFLHHFIVEADGEPIGFCQFYEYAHGGEEWHGDLDVAGVYSIDYLIGETACLGKGNGAAIVGALVARIAARADARRIIVQPEPENKASCGALLSNGFSFDPARKLYALDIAAADRSET